MSSAPDAHGHDAPHAPAFTGEPVQVLSPDEPRTPDWLPLLGTALFTVAAIVFLVGHGNAETPGAAGAADTPVTIKPTTAPAPAPAPPAPVPTAADTVRKITPEQQQVVRKNAEQAKTKGLLPGGNKRPAPTRGATSP